MRLQYYVRGLQQLHACDEVTILCDRVRILSDGVTT